MSATATLPVPGHTPAAERVITPCTADWSRAEAKAAAVPAGKVREIKTPTDYYVLVAGESGLYEVRPEAGGWSCTCTAGQHGRPCYHVASAQPRCCHCGTDRSQVNSDLCAGCAAVLAEREAPAPAAVEPIPFPVPAQSAVAIHLDALRERIERQTSDPSYYRPRSLDRFL